MLNASFIGEHRELGRAVESVGQVLPERGVQIAARTYRSWKTAGPSDRDLEGAAIIDANLAACVDENGKATPEAMYGRRKMTALLLGKARPFRNGEWSG